MENAGARLNERQKRFAENYLASGNARRSAINAGYSAGYAAVVKNRRNVRKYLSERIGGMDKERMADTDEVLMYLTNVLRGENGEGDTARMKAAELIAKRLGLFSENAERPERAQVVDDVRASEEGK